MTFLFSSLLHGHIWGGSEELWSRTAAILASRGHHVVASVEGRDPFAERLRLMESNGIEVSRRAHRPPSILWRLAAKLRRMEPDAFHLERMKSQIASVRPDMVCISNGRVVDDVRFLEMALEASTRVVNISQANAEEWWPHDSYGRRCTDALKRCQGCFFVSEGNLRLWQTQTATRYPNASVVRNPFNVSYDANPVWPELGDAVRLACVGRLDPRSKGQDLLLRMMALPQWRQRALTVSFFGQGPMEDMLRRLVTSLELCDRVFFHGHVENIEEIWKRHHAMILPSRYEGLPLAVVEAMLCQRIAIVTDVAGNSEVLDDGKTGFIAPFPSVKDLSQTMERAWACRCDWEKMGKDAGLSIRSKVPSDPASQFADQLEALVRSKTRQTS